MSKDYPEEKTMTQRDAEMYVQALWDLYLTLGGDGHSKRYDPLTFEGNIAHSYVLELWDGGRHHDMTGILYCARHKRLVPRNIKPAQLPPL